jgi:hypothetical protein
LLIWPPPAPNQQVNNSTDLDQQTNNSTIQQILVNAAASELVSFLSDKMRVQ